MFKKFAAAVLAVAYVSMFLTGCAPANQGQGSSQLSGNEISSSGENTAQPVVFTDALGHEVQVQNPQRVVALMGSFAETWLLAGGELVGVTEDAFSERNLSLPEDIEIVGGVKAPSLEKIIALNADFVILSADTDGQVSMYDSLKAAGINCAYFHVDAFEEYLDMLKICTDITGREDLYQQNGLDVQAQIDAAIARSQGQEQPSVLFIRAFSTGAKAKRADNMTGKMLLDLGCDNIADRHDSLLEDLSMEVIIEEDPDYIFVVTMGSDSQKALDALKEGVQANPAWATLSAVQNGRYIVLPKDLFHYKPNARWGESYEYLADILYPQQ